MPSIFEEFYAVAKDFHSEDGKLIHTGAVYRNSHYSLASGDGLVLQLYRVVNGKREWLRVKEEELNIYFV